MNATPSSCLPKPGTNRNQRPSRRRVLKKFLAAISAVFIATLTWLIFGGSSEPSHEGRKLSAWAGDLVQPGGANRTKAAQAIRAIGSEAIPTLRQMLNAEESNLKSKTTKALSFFGVRSLTPLEEQYRAIVACRHLGPAADPIVPELVARLRMDNITQHNALTVTLGKLAPDSSGLTTAIQNALQSSDSQWRAGVLRAVPFIVPDSEAKVSLLTRHLNDPDGWTRWQAATALTALNHNEKRTVREAIKDNGKFSRETQRRAIAALEGRDLRE